MKTAAVWVAEFVAKPAVVEALHDLLVRTDVAVVAVPAVFAAALRGLVVVVVASGTSYVVAAALAVVPFDAETATPRTWIKAEMKSCWLK